MAQQGAGADAGDSRAVARAVKVNPYSRRKFPCGGGYESNAGRNGELRLEHTAGA